MSNFLKWIIMESVLMLIIFVWVIDCSVKKRELLPGTFEGKEDVVVKVFLLAGAAYVVVGGIIPECMDLPYFYNNEFCYLEGTAQNHSDKSVRGERTIDIKDEDSGEIICVHFGYEGTIERGDRLKVKYLPNSKQAALLEINGKKLMTKINTDRVYVRSLILMAAIGIIAIAVCLLHIKAVLACTIETTGTYIKYNFAGNRRGEADYEPVFQYYYRGKKFQGGCINRMYLSDIQKKFVPGQTYTIYVSNKDPGRFAISRKVPGGDIFGIVMGICFIFMAVS